MPNLRVPAAAPVASPSPAAATVDGAKRWAEGAAWRSSALNVPRTQAPTTGPQAVQRAYALYRTWEERDLGSVRLLRADVDGRDVWAVHTSTDGDDSFLEVFGGRGALLASGIVAPDGSVAWDAVPGAVRDRVARLDASQSVDAFFQDISAALDPASASGSGVGADELRRAAARLIGGELTTSSVDGDENAALRRLLASADRLTPAARAYALRLGELYVSQGPKVLRDRSTQPAATVTSTTTAFSTSAQLSRSDISGRQDAPRVDAFISLLRDAHGLLPTQVVPASRAVAFDLLKSAGATSAEARALVDALAADDALLYTGKVYAHDASSSSSVPRLQGVAVFSASANGKEVAAVFAPQTTPTPPAPDAAVRTLTGVNRPADVVTDLGAGRYALEWRPARGGLLRATVDVSDPQRPAVVDATAPPVLERLLRDLLQQHVATAQGVPAAAVEVLGWVGRDNSEGPGSVVAHRASGTLWPVQLSTVRIALGGAATVTPKTIGTGAEDATLARDLALVLARAQAQRLVDDPTVGPDARLEVALRTGWSQDSDLVTHDENTSPVGFDPATDRVQLQMSRVWGDNAVVVTFAKDGRLRVEDVN